MGIFDIETSIQELDDKITALLPEENYASHELGHPHRLLSRIYSAICRPQMTFNADYVSEYTKVLGMMDQFMANYAEVPEMEEIRKSFAEYCAKEYDMDV